MNNILLIDVDKSCPNLALMKISRWHKSLGDKVWLNNCPIKPDKVYASCVFKKNCGEIEKLKKCYPDAEIGGSGVDLKKWLDDTIEHLKPDYDLYKDFDFGIRSKQNDLHWLVSSLGFTSRGCPRHCPYCIVHDKEGSIRAWASIYEFWDRERHKYIILMDNNILAAPNFEETCNDIIREKLFVDINQGLDIRLVNDDNANLLSRLKIKAGRGRDLRFAFDLMEVEPAIRKNVPKLVRAGINSKRLVFYVICGFNTTMEQNLHRIQVLNELNARAYVMLFEDASEELKHFQVWNNICNKTHPNLTCKFEDYKPYKNFKSKNRIGDLYATTTS